MRTLNQHIKQLSTIEFEELSRMCTESRKLYNSALYIINCYFKETNKYLGYNEVYHIIKTNDHYKALPSKIAQQILRLVDKNFRSFFTLLQKKHRGEYAAQVKSPRYLHKDSKYLLILPSDQVSLYKGKLKVTKGLRIPFTYEIKGVIKQVIIIPHKDNNYYTISIQYDEVPNTNLNLDKSKCLAIDLGLNNFASCITNIGHSFIVNGKPLKAYNQFYNKSKAKIQGELKTKNNKHWSNRLSRLNINRSNWINNYLNQTVSYIIKQCLSNNIGTLVCGYNETWKQEINLGSKTNQNFVSIPFFLFKRKLESKCNDHFIDFILQEESYTSKCSFLDNEPIEKQETYKGQRVKRGLFKTSTNIMCNADVQAAGNILRKAVPNASWSNGIEGSIVSPVKLKHCFNLQK